MPLLFWGEQFRTKLAGFEKDNGEIVHLHLGNLQPCCASMHGKYQKTLCMHQPLEYVKLVDPV